MGLFDNIRDHRVKCPRCGSAAFIEMQTKSIDPGWGGTMETYLPHYKSGPAGTCYGCHPFLGQLAKYEKHRLPEDHAAVIRAHASCRNASCAARDRAIRYLRDGWVGHGSFSFEVEYQTKNRFIVGRPRIKPASWPEPDAFEKMPMAKLSRLLSAKAAERAGHRARWKRCMALAGGQPLLAVLGFDPPFPRRRAKGVRRPRPLGTVGRLRRDPACTFRVPRKLRLPRGRTLKSQEIDEELYGGG